MLVLISGYRSLLGNVADVRCRPRGSRECWQAPTFTAGSEMLLSGNILMIVLECCREPTKGCQALVLAARRRRCGAGIGRRAARGRPDAGGDRQKAGHGPHDGDRYGSGAELNGEPLFRALQSHGLRPDCRAARGSRHSGSRWRKRLPSMSKDPRDLNVWLGGRVVADLTVNRQKVAQLRYLGDYVAERGEGALGLSVPLPVSSRRFAGDPVDYWMVSLL